MGLHVQNDGHVRVHAYTDEEGLTLFCVDFPNGNRLQFGAYVTEFELTTEREELTSMFDSYRSFAPMEQRINLEAQVVRRAEYSRITPNAEITHEAKQIAPARKELES